MIILDVITDVYLCVSDINRIINSSAAYAINDTSEYKRSPTPHISDAPPFPRKNDVSKYKLCLYMAVRRLL